MWNYSQLQKLDKTKRPSSSLSLHIVYKDIGCVWKLRLKLNADTIPYLYQPLHMDRDVSCSNSHNEHIAMDAHAMSSSFSSAPSSPASLFSLSVFFHLSNCIIFSSFPLLIFPSFFPSFVFGLLRLHARHCGGLFF